MPELLLRSVVAAEAAVAALKQTRIVCTGIGIMVFVFVTRGMTEKNATPARRDMVIMARIFAIRRFNANMDTKKAVRVFATEVMAERFATDVQADMAKTAQAFV